MNRTLVFVLVLVALAVAGFLIFKSLSPAPTTPATSQQNNQNQTQKPPATTPPSQTTQPATSNPQTNTSTPAGDTSTAIYTGNVKNPNVFVQASIAGVNTLDPAHSYDTASSELIMNIYDNLIAFDGPSIYKFVPMLATTVPTVENGLLKINPDGTMVMTFPMRTGVKFQSGKEMTPDDVVYSFQRIMVHSHPDSPAWIFLEDLLDVEDFGDLATKVGDDKACQMLLDSVHADGQNVIFKFPHPSTTFLARIAHGATWGSVTNKEFVIAHGGWDGKCGDWRKYYQLDKENLPLHAAADGTGPFKLERWTPGEVTVLVKNPGYWRGAAKLDRAEFRVVTEFGTRKLMIQQGDADMIDVPRPYISQMTGLPGIRTIYDMPLIADTTAFFNYDIPTEGNPNIGTGKMDGQGIPPDFFTDVDVRKAFNYSFNWKEFLDQIYLGEATQPNGPIPSSLPYVNKENPKYSYDPKQAEEHFRKAWGGKLWDIGFKFTIIYNEGNEQRKVAAEMLKENIEALNDKFHIEVRSEPSSTFLDDFRSRKVPIWISGWQSDFPDAHNFIQPYMHSQGAHAVREHLSKIANFDDEVIAAAHETDPAKRQAIYYHLQQEAYDLAIDIFMVDLTDREWQRTWVNGWSYNPIWPGTVRYLYGLSKQDNGQIDPRILTDMPGSKTDSW